MKYIVDTDPGIDDAIAICLGSLNNLDIIGYTLECGNSSIENVENNIKVIQHFVNKPFKIYKENIKYESISAGFAHGTSGIGYDFFPKFDYPIEEKSASDFILESATLYQDDLTIICLGPCINIYNALQKDPSLAGKIHGIIMMGASYMPFDEKPYQEFNFWVNPKATNSVLSAGFKSIHLITHEIGVLAQIKKDDVIKLIHSANIVSRFVALISPVYMKFSKDYYNVDGLCMPDPITMAYAIDESIVDFDRVDVSVVETGDDKGLTITKASNDSNIYISKSFDEEKFTKLFLKTFL